MAIKKIFSFFFIQLFLIGLGASIVGPLIPIVAHDFNVKLNVVGFVLSLYAFSLLMGNLLSGILSERFGGRNIFFLSNILFTISFLGIYFLKNFIFFTICYAIFGFAWGIIYVNLVSVISDVSKLNKSRTILRLNIGFNIGFLLAPILVSGVLFLNISWRYIFLSIAILNIILLVFILLFKIEGFYKVKSEENFISLLIVNRKLLSKLVIIQ